MSFNIDKAQIVKWVPKYGGNRELPENDRFHCLVRELPPKKVIALKGLVVNGMAGSEAVEKIIGLGEESIIEVKNCSCYDVDMNEMPIENASQLFDRMGISLFREFCEFLGNPVDEEDIENLEVPSSGS